MKEEIIEAIKPYKGNYIKEMRKFVGHAPLMSTACGVIIENAEGEILLQQRTDNGKWGLPGGAMEIGESYIDTAKREVFEEAGIEVDNLSLFGIYSGEDRIIVYPNQDICCVTCIILKTSTYQGTILDRTEEALKHAFFSRDQLPEELNEFDRRYLNDWKNNVTGIVIG